MRISRPLARSAALAAMLGLTTAALAQDSPRRAIGNHGQDAMDRLEGAVARARNDGARSPDPRQPKVDRPADRHRAFERLGKRQIAMDQNGDLSLNLTPQTAAAMWRAGLLNESQLGAIANGGQARFSFAHNDLLVSSGTTFSQSARSDTSTRFEAGKQAGPDTIEHFIGGSAEGQAMMANWLRGGFEMDRKGEWRLKPQVADTLQRDVQAVMTQTGWQRSLTRSSNHQITQGISVDGLLGSGAEASSGTSSGPRGDRRASATSGTANVRIGAGTSDQGISSTHTQGTINIVNYDTRTAIAHAERAASRSKTPEQAFAHELSSQILGERGLRNKYLGEADAGRGVGDLFAPITSSEQRTILDSGRFSGDREHGAWDGDSEYKKR